MNFSQLLSLSFAAILGENLVFVRLFGVDGLSKATKKPALVGGAMVPVMAFSSAVGAIVYNSVLIPLGLQYLQLILFTAIAALFAKAAESALSALIKEKAELFPMVTLNCSLLAVMLINTQNGSTSMESLVYGALCAVGFAIALFVYHSVTQRLLLASPGGSFEGAPVAFITIGLVAMAFMGFAEVDLGEVASLPFKLSK